MKTTVPSILVLLFALSLSFSTKAADVIINTAQTFSSLDASDGSADGIFNVSGNLTIGYGGSITFNDPSSPPASGGGTIIIVVTGNMDIQAGGSIYAENTVASGNGGDISITVGGTFMMRNTAVISSSNLSATSGSMQAGAITIHVTGQVNLLRSSLIKGFSFKGKAGDIEITSSSNIVADGTVISESSGTGTGTNQGHGGMITLIANCTLRIGDNGKVSSEGRDPGADLVHLEACTVSVYGLVQSTGVGHGIPSSPPNHLSGTFRPDKPSFSTAGVEIWANNITIDKLNHNGEVKAVTGASPGGIDGTSWIDILASAEINIYGSLSGNYAVGANGGGGNDDGGVVTVKSTTSSILLRNLSLQSSALSNGGAGGTIVIEAKKDVDLNSANIQAAGSTGGGGSQHGGHINIRSYGHILSNASAVLDVTGDSPADGTVDLKACGTVGFPQGTITPGSITGSKTTGLCSGNPILESYVIIPAANCQSLCPQLTTLPVEMVSFTAKRTNDFVTLKWSTATEVNNRGFELERRIKNNTNFETLAFVTSRASGGNSTAQLQYEYNDVNSAADVSYYRLKQIDLDGHFKYSEIRIVNGVKSQASMLVYPNPAVNTDVNVSFSTEDKRDIQLTDMSGQIIKSWKEFKEQQLKLSNLKSGIYVLRVKNLVSEDMQMQKIVVTR